MVIVLSLNSRELEELIPLNSDADRATEERWQGCGWLLELRRQSEIEILTSLQAKERITAGVLEPTECLVLQEEDKDHGLFELGCIPWLNFCLESPLYTRQFYAHIDAYRDRFMHSMYFDWKDHKKTQPVYFPSFGEGEIMIPEPLEHREFMTCIMSNKFGGQEVENSLMKSRLDALNCFLNRPGFHLYGRGWAESAFCLEVGFKTPILRNSRFTLCYENYSMPGYVTEKAIHALVAGSIPVYLGAPDIEFYLPSDLFIDARHKTPEAIWRECHTLPNVVAKDMIQAGQSWLKTDGAAFTYRSFAKRVLDLLP